MDKKSLREYMLSKRLNESESNTLFDDLINDKLKAIIYSDENRAKLVAAYMPTKGEVNITPLIQHLALNNRTVLLPRIIRPYEKGEMQFKRFLGFENLTANKWNILEPHDSAEMLTPDIMIIPLLAYDDYNFRLGYGGGYYDRFLSSKGEYILKIGVAYSFQKVKSVFHQPHDIPMDIIVTEIT